MVSTQEKWRLAWSGALLSWKHARRQAVSFWKGLHEQVGSENNKLRVSWLPSTLSLVLPSSGPLCRPYWGPEGLTDFTPVQKLLKGGGRLLPLLGPQLRWVHVFLRTLRVQQRFLGGAGELHPGDSGEPPASFCSSSASDVQSPGSGFSVLHKRGCCSLMHSLRDTLVSGGIVV